MKTSKVAKVSLALAIVGAAVLTAAPAYAAQTDPVAKLKKGVLSIVGTNAADRIALRLHPGQQAIDVDFGDDGLADGTFPRSAVSKITIDLQAGDDFARIDEINGIFTDTIPTTISGGDGNDTLIGGSGAETLIGGAGNDTIFGKRGADTALMGDGDDAFIWDPGDGSDVVEGQAGVDTLRFDGANVGEHFDLSANGSRRRPPAGPADGSHCRGQPVGWLIDRVDPELFMFSTDYPHPEGTKMPLGRFEATLTGVADADGDRFYASKLRRVDGLTPARRVLTGRR
jgi:Ca2+-binding RTX toxin-like protein